MPSRAAGSPLSRIVRTVRGDGRPNSSAICCAVISLVIPLPLLIAVEGGDSYAGLLFMVTPSMINSGWHHLFKPLWRSVMSAHLPYPQFAQGPRHALYPILPGLGGGAGWIEALFMREAG